MNNLLRYLTAIYLIFSVILSISLSLPLASVSEHTIYTRMTDIVVPPELVYRENYPNWTFFEFEYSFEIINPSDKTLYIISHTTCLIFISGNLSFENKQYDGQVWGPSTLGNIFTNHTINPGITEGTRIINLEVNDTLNALPNGNFTVWMHLDDSEKRHNYHHFTSEIAVNGSDILITHNGANTTFTFPEEPTPTSTLHYSTLVTLLIGLIVIIHIKKRDGLDYF